MQDEQAILVRYVGWGGLPQVFDHRNSDWAGEFKELAALLTTEEYEAARRSTQDAHYTSDTIIKGIYDGLERIGFTGGKVLEPAAGICHFIGLQPDSLRSKNKVTAIELEPLTAAISKALYPKATVINRGFQDVTIPSDYFDAAIGNPPFGSQSVYDANHKDLSELSIHNYFIAKSLDKVRPGGVVAVVVSNFFLDAKNPIARERVAQQANLLGAIRLPNTAFKQNALTEVTTDIVFLQKRIAGQQVDLSWVNTGIVRDPASQGEIELNQYFIGHPDMMLGEMALAGTMYRGGQAALIAPPEQDLSDELAKAVAKLPQGVYVALESAPCIDIARRDEAVEVPDNTKIGAYFVTAGGKIARRLPDILDERNYEYAELRNEKAGERIKGMIEVRSALRQLMLAEQSERTADAELNQLRSQLNRVYDRFVKKHGYISAQVNKQAFAEDPEYPLLHALERDYDRGISKEIARKTGVEPRDSSAQKAAIFTQRVMNPHRQITRVESAKDALVVSMNEVGRVEMERMVRMSGRPEDELVRELDGLIFRNPKGTWETGAQYLSGNVKKKLAEAIEASAGDASYETNVHALRRVQPAAIEPVDISIQLGSTWVPERYVTSFVQHLLGGVRTNISYQPSLGKWVAKIGPSPDKTTMRVTWGTEDVAATELIENILAGRATRVKEQVGRDDNGPIMRVNEAKTAAANQKADEIKQAFLDWVWEDKERRETLARTYNDLFNTNVPPRYDGSHLTLPGSSAAITLRPHQKDAIWRGVQEGTALFDHVVGAGKTIVCVGAVMESRRMGLLKKPMVVVPNHLLLQWKDAFYELYPTANILVAEKGDFKKESRERLFAKIATGSWDAVIVAHSSFKKIGMPDETLSEILHEQINDLTDSIIRLRSEGGDRITVKEMEKSRDRMKAKLEKAAETGKKDLAVTFADLGVDGLFVDEAHEFKNLFINTTMNRVSGLGNLAGSDKAFDLFVKARYIQSKYDGRGVFFATGTPISNTIAELYTVQRYLQYDELKRRGIVHFDAWASTFGQVVTGWELDATGVNYKLNSRFAKFQNVPELISLYRSFADVITKSDLDRQAAEQGRRFPVPKIKGGKPINVIVERSPLQAEYMGIQSKALDDHGNPLMRADGSFFTNWNRGSIIQRMENLPKDPRLDNPLKITNDARKAGLDFRLIEPSAPDFEGSKVNEAVKRIYDIWDSWRERKGTQLVFCDLSTPKNLKSIDATQTASVDDGGPEAPDENDVSISMDELLAGTVNFSVYDDLRNKLIALGVPPEEIRFIHEANTDAKKQKLFDQINRGDVRIILGSTTKMGAGTNVQRRLVAEHHLDAPWRPSDLEQREGRILRQGNMFYDEDPDGFEVEIYRYATKQTYDSRMWQTIEYKAAGIEQFRRGDSLQRVIEDIASEAANAAEMKAAATGNPLIFMQVQINADLKKVEALYSNYKRNRHSLEDRVGWLQRADTRADTSISNARMEIAIRERNSAKEKEDEIFLVDGRAYKKDAHDVLLGALRGCMLQAIKQQSTAVFDKPEMIPVGKYRGFDVAVYCERGLVRFTMNGHHLHTPENLTYKADDEFKISGFFSRMDNFLGRLDLRIDDAERQREQDQLELDKAKKELQKPFAQLAKLEMLRKDAADVMTELKKMQADPAYVSEWKPVSHADDTLHQGALALSVEHTTQQTVISPETSTEQAHNQEDIPADQPFPQRDPGKHDLFGQEKREAPSITVDARKRGEQAVHDYFAASHDPGRAGEILGGRQHDRLFEMGDGEAVHQVLLERIQLDPLFAKVVTNFPCDRYATMRMLTRAHESMDRFKEAMDIGNEMELQPQLPDRHSGLYVGRIVGMTDHFVVQQTSAENCVIHPRKAFIDVETMSPQRTIQIKYQHGIALVRTEKLGGGIAR
ncbi:helicase-related protein [Chromobacterium piscinae]|uniref:KfrB domain-containing protein n=1 Tax=Chromobacterium piscinae TaxID=686831 RepID=UPI001E4C7074|nr:helicase-related protein [Chromobacterium piscinae]MCD5327963.1 DEAD/DEAH box helicase family protein [Chromobacterium piscinae]